MVDLLRWWPAVRALARRPALWPYALRMVPPGWWKRWPPLPLPSGEYVRFRLEAMYARPDAVPLAEDLVGYLEWCRRMGRQLR